MTSMYDVLKASKGIHVDDTFAELWGRKLSNAYTVATYTGTLPTTLQTVEGYLESYKIYGNAEQNGTPTPENPIVPSGCGVRTGNVMPSAPAETKSSNGVTITCDGNGVYTLSGTALRGTYIVFRFKDFTIPISVGQGGQGTMSLFNTVPSGQISMAFLNGSTSIDAWLINSVNRKSNSYAAMSGAVCNAFQFYVPSGNNCDCVIKPCFTNDSIYPATYIPYGYKLSLTVNGVEYPIYIGDKSLVKDEYVDSTTGKIYRRTENLSPPEEEWMDEWIWGDGTIHPSTEIKTSPFIDVSTCETCIMEVFSTETEWAAAGYRAMAFYDENKQYLGWIGGGGGQTLTPNSTERWSEFPAGTVYVRIGCSHGDQPFYPQLVSGYTPTHQFYPYLVPTDPPAPFPQIPTVAGTTVIDYNGEPKPEKVELTYRKPKGQ